MGIARRWAGVALLGATVVWAAGEAPVTPPLTLQDQPLAQAAAGARIVLRGATAPGAVVTLKINGDTRTAKADDKGVFQFADVTLRAGANQIALTAVDAAGRQTAIERQVTAPESAGGAVRSANPDALLAGGPSVEIVGTASPDSQVTVMRGEVLVGSAKAGLDGQWRLPLDLADGGWVVSLNLEPGGAGLRRLEIDREAPLLQLVTPGPIEYVERNPFAIGGRSEPGATIKLTQEGGPAISAVANAQGFFDLTTIPVVDGINRYTMTLTDDLGNQRTTPVTIWGRISNPLLEVASPAEGWQSTKSVDLTLAHEAGVTVTATLNGRSQPVTGTQSVTGTFAVPRATSVVDAGPLEPGPYELAVTAVSPSGERRSAVVRRFHLPGFPRHVALSPSVRAVDPSESITLGIEVIDAWRQHVADGTPVLVAAPDGWAIDGAVPPGVRALVQTKGGLAEVKLSPKPGALAGLVQVTCGLVNESVPVNVAAPIKH